MVVTESLSLELKPIKLAVTDQIDIQVLPGSGAGVGKVVSGFVEQRSFLLEEEP